jgi:hypothetical protein
MTTRVKNKINVFHQDNFTCHFSNFPEIFEDPSQKVDLGLYDMFVKNVVIPDMNMDVVPLEYRNSTVWQPISKANSDLPQIIIEFKADENLRNYYYLFSYIKKMRYGVDPQPSRSNTINAIGINTLDNQNKKMARLEFTEALPVSVGSLTLMSGDSEELSFAVSFQYEEFKLAMFNENGDVIYED